MRVKKRGLNIGFVYPCTKREIHEVFGRELVSSINFKDKFDPMTFRGRKRPEVKGLILAEAFVLRSDEAERLSAWLYIYQIREEAFSVHLHLALLELMRTVVKPWVQTRLAELGADNSRWWYLLIELGEKGLLVHEIKCTNRGNEISQLPA